MNTILRDLNRYNTHLPEDRLYIHFDKTLYKPGETIWFAVYVRDGQTLKASKKSEIVTVELLDPKGKVKTTLRIITEDGIGRGDFQLEDTIPGGQYKVQATSQWIKNDKNPAIFIKDLTVQKVILPRLKMKLNFSKKAYSHGDEVVATLRLQDNTNKFLSDFEVNFVVNLNHKTVIKGTTKTDKNGKTFIKFNLPDKIQTNDGLLNIMVNYQGQTESISRSIPIVMNKINVGFYPEGGDLVNDLYSKVAFKAVNEFGKPADVEGNVLNQNGDIITTFSSFHHGMGALEFAPEKGETYHAEITKPLGIDTQFPLPKALESGHTLSVEAIEDGKITLSINSTEKEKVYIVGNIRGKNYYTINFDTVFTNKQLTIDTTAFPMGIMHFTLFNSQRVECAERLIFINSDKQLNIKIATNKEKYAPRELVKMEMEVTDNDGNPVASNFSMSVADDQLLSFADDKSSNILSWLLLESGIKAKVEAPNFYFDKNEPKAAQALDYLLMTTGWRRFTWADIRSKELPKIKFKNEIRIFEGQAFKFSRGKQKPLRGAKVQIGELHTKTDNNGRFRFEHINITPESELILTKFNHKTQKYNIHSYKYSSEGCIIYTKKRFQPLRFLLLLILFPFFLLKESFKKGNITPTPGYVNYSGDDRDFGGIEPQEVEIGDASSIIDDVNIIEVNDKRLLKKKRVPSSEHLSFFKDNYHREREFPKPLYDENEKVEKRTDFRSTVYWAGNVKVDTNGKAKIEFYNSDAVTSFRIITEGISTKGMVGRQEKCFYTQLPFLFSTKLPVEVVTGDIVKIPLTLINNMDKAMVGDLTYQIPKGLLPKSPLPLKVRLEKKEAITQYLAFDVVLKGKQNKLGIKFESEGITNEVEQILEIVPNGFPVERFFSSSAESHLLKKQFTFSINTMIQGSMVANFSVKSSMLDDLIKSIEGMIRQPYGCFEQTTSAVYPNILILQFLKIYGTNQTDKIEKARQYIEEGYKRLMTFESKNGGFHWFGSSPADEGLTAYGLMEFIEMQAVYDGVDTEMIERTTNWLLSRRTGKGDYKLHFGKIFNITKTETTNLYITWALSEAKFKNLETEIDFAYLTAKESLNPYLLSLAANTVFNYGWYQEGEDLVKIILRIQEKNGNWEHPKKFRSMPGSSGVSLQIETAALAALAIMKSTNRRHPKLNLCIDFIKSQQSTYGNFGSTNSTVLALKALLEFYKTTPSAINTNPNGILDLTINGQNVTHLPYQKDKNLTIGIDTIGEYLHLGRNQIDIEFLKADSPLAYNIGINYLTTLPESSPNCAIELVTTLDKVRVVVGETVRLTAFIKNKTVNHQAMTLAIIGFPAGLSLQPWQLKTLLERKQVAFYEIHGNNLVLYYNGMKPAEIKKVSLDLKVEIAGTYSSPASCAYLYYTDEHKDWTILERIEVLEK